MSSLSKKKNEMRRTREATIKESGKEERIISKEHYEGGGGAHIWEKELEAQGGKKSRYAHL